MPMSHEVVIAIPNDALQPTIQGLGFAIRFVPSPIKKAFSGRLAYTWQGEATDKDGQRWVLLKVIIGG